MGAGAATPVSTAELEQQQEALAACCRRLHGRGLLSGAEGNCSVRLSDGTVLITASGVDKANITARLVVRRHADGTEYHAAPSAAVMQDTHGGDPVVHPSSEMQMHLTLYAARPDVHAIVHAHPPVATGFATAGRTLPHNVLPELPVVVGPVALVPYGRPGTQSLSDALIPYVAGHEVYLLANHGVTVVGTTLGDALLRMESVEQAARTLLVAEVLGGARELPVAEAEALVGLRRRSSPPPRDVL